MIAPHPDKEPEHLASNVKPLVLIDRYQSITLCTVDIGSGSMSPQFRARHFQSPTRRQCHGDRVGEEYPVPRNAMVGRRILFILSHGHEVTLQRIVTHKNAMLSNEKRRHLMPPMPAP